MEFVKIVLCEGKKVRDPDSGTYLEAGKVYKMPKKQFWFRRLACGDVKLAMEEPKKKVTKKKVTKKTEE